MNPPRAEKTGLRLHFLAILCAASAAVIPLIVHGCSCGHDFDFHVVSWIEAARQFSHGNLYPRWAYSPAYFAGEPRFVFYPPLSWMLGGLIGLILTHVPWLPVGAAWNAVPIVFTYLALALGGLTFYRLASEFASRNIALICAMVYLANPYVLFTAYERTAYAELLAAAWIPLVLLSILRQRITLSGIALPLALLWLTNAPAAVMGSYTLVTLAILRVVSAGRESGFQDRVVRKIASRVAAGIVLGMAMASIYIIPAEAERRFVQITMVLVPGMRIRDNFIFPQHWDIPLLHFTVDPAVLADTAHSEVLETVSWIALTLVIVTVVLLVRALPAVRPGKSIVVPKGIVVSLLILVLGAGLLMTPFTTPIWRYVPEVSFLQFPWRLLAIVGAVMALALALAFPKTRTTNAPAGKVRLVAFYAPAIGLAAAALLVWCGYHLYQQSCDEEDTAPAQLEMVQTGIGSAPTDEYTPATADNDSLKQNVPAFWLADAPNAAPAENPNTAAHGPAPLHLQISTPKPEYLVLNLRDYPTWHVFSNGRLVTARERREDGLLTFPVPTGNSNIEIRHVVSWNEILGAAVTTGALFVWILLSSERATRPPPVGAQ